MQKLILNKDSNSENITIRLLDNRKSQELIGRESINERQRTINSETKS